MNSDTARAQLSRERDELSATVQELADRFDVGARAREAAGSVRSRAVTGWNQVVRSPAFIPAVSVVGAGLALAASARLIRRHG